MKTKGEIALNLALSRGLITKADYDLINMGRHKDIPDPGWSLGGYTDLEDKTGFINALFPDSLESRKEFLEEVMRIQEGVKVSPEDYPNLKFILTTAERAGKCQVVGGNHSDQIVEFRTGHGQHNMWICTNCVEASLDLLKDS